MIVDDEQDLSVPSLFSVCLGIRFNTLIWNSPFNSHQGHLQFCVVLTNSDTKQSDEGCIFYTLNTGMFYGRYVTLASSIRMLTFWKFVKLQTLNKNVHFNKHKQSLLFIVILVDISSSDMKFQLTDVNFQLKLEQIFAVSFFSDGDSGKFLFLRANYFLNFRAFFRYAVMASLATAWFWFARSTFGAFTFWKFRIPLIETRFPVY